MQAGEVLFTFQPVEVNKGLGFDQVKIRVNPTSPSRWEGPSLIIQARVPKVGVVVFDFGLPDKAAEGELIWSTSTPVWPPKNKAARIKIIDGVRTVVRVFLTSFPEVGIDPSAANSISDLGTYYEVTGSVQPRQVGSKKSPKSKAPKARPRPKIKFVDQGVQTSKLDFLHLF